MESRPKACMKKTASFYLTTQPLCGRLLRSIAAVLDHRCSVALLAALALPGLTSRAGTSPGITAVHTFAALENESAPYVNADGASPAARMTLGKDGNLYGTTSAGGNGAGNVFVVTTSGRFTNLYNFQGITESNNPLGNDYYGDFLPNELTPGPMNFFFGTTQNGGQPKWHHF